MLSLYDSCNSKLTLASLMVIYLFLSFVIDGIPKMESYKMFKKLTGGQEKGDKSLPLKN